VYKKIGCGIVAGGIGAFVGNPADLALTRMQADATLPAASQRKYAGVFDAIQRMMREGGVTALWRGALPTISRAAAVTAGQMATYDSTKNAMAPLLGGSSKSKESWPNRIFAACCSGSVAAIAGLPFDMTKTRMMRQAKDASGKYPYRNMAHCAAQIVAKEGPLALWTGLPTFWVRLAPHTILTLLFMDMLLPQYRAGRVVTKEWLHASPQ
jgi:solute carrier family 25 oxoglutarate transporter 11